MTDSQRVSWTLDSIRNSCDVLYYERKTNTSEMGDFGALCGNQTSNNVRTGRDGRIPIALSSKSSSDTYSDVIAEYR